MENPRYLGDGLYAEYDGYQILLKANDHIHPTDTVAVDRSVYEALNRFATELGWDE